MRCVEDITEALWGMRVSPQTVSDLNQKVYKQIEALRNKPINYVYIDVTIAQANAGRRSRSLMV